MLFQKYKSIAALLILLSGCTSFNPNQIKNEIHEITRISDMKPMLESLPLGALTVFDVDFVLIAPNDLLGLPNSKAIRREVFTEIKGQHGAKVKKDLLIKFNVLVERSFVEPEIEGILKGLFKRSIDTIALSAVSMKPIPLVKDPMALRLRHLKNVGIIFKEDDEVMNRTWGKDSGYKNGIILSGGQPKGEALQYYLENISKALPSKIIFVDDMIKNVRSVQAMCKHLAIPFVGFHYVAETFKGKVADPDLARLQLKLLHEQGRWFNDTQAKEIQKNLKKGEGS